MHAIKSRKKQCTNERKVQVKIKLKLYLNLTNPNQITTIEKNQCQMSFLSLTVKIL